MPDRPSGGGRGRDRKHTAKPGQQPEIKIRMGGAPIDVIKPAAPKLQPRMQEQHRTYDSPLVAPGAQQPIDYSTPGGANGSSGNLGSDKTSPGGGSGVNPLVGNFDWLLKSTKRTGRQKSDRRNRGIL